MKDQSAEKILASTIEKVRDLVDVSTIIGEPIKVDDDVTIIPVSKVTYGFASGGSDFPSKNNVELFGGAGGGGISITPVAFIVIQDSKVRLMQINNYTSSADRAIAMIPELVDKLTELTEAKKKDSPAEEKAE